MTKIGKPKIDTRPTMIYMGIRTIAPFKGMSKMIDSIRKELNAWVAENTIQLAGTPFLRYHVIDMRGFMDISYGVPVDKVLPDEGDIKGGELPPGRYASLIYSGGGISANRALIEWVRGNETFLTDPKREPRKSKWEIEVAIKLAEK